MEVKYSINQSAEVPLSDDLIRLLVIFFRVTIPFRSH